MTVVRFNPQSDDGQKQPLSKRELQIAAWIQRGERPVDVAKRLHIASKTVYTHLAHIREKTGQSRADLHMVEVRKLVREAADFIQQERETLFRSFELEGVIDDVDVAQEISNMDSWLKRAKEFAP
jgi:DNA-binding CsgD family transcriptional regulator